MKAALYIRKQGLHTDPRFIALQADLLQRGCQTYEVRDIEQLQKDTDVLLSIGGDGTFLSAAQIAAPSGLPILGVNLGRLGFMSEYKAEEVVEPLLSGAYTIEERVMLKPSVSGMGDCPAALNEVSLHRIGAAMLGIDVSVDGQSLPTYWADGLLVATSSGSTAYSLSVGGPICMPESRVLIIAPIAPHNLNVRPLVVPDSCHVGMSVRSRDPQVMMTMDNNNIILDRSSKVEVEVAQFSLKRIRLEKSNFIKALGSKLLWGEDVRNQ